jgi:hypothetical protein
MAARIPTSVFAEQQRTAIRAGRLVVPPRSLALELSTLWKGMSVGVYTFAVTPSAERDEMIVAHAFTVRVKIGFVTAYRYRHEVEEVWRDGLLRSLASRTDDDGEETAVTVERIDDHLRMAGPGGPQRIAGDILTTTCAWHPAFVARNSVLDASDGSVVSLTIGDAGRERLRIDGSDVDAAVYEFRSPSLCGRLWYRERGTLVRAAIERKGHRLLMTAA